MPVNPSEISSLLLHYFRQQEQLFGDGYILSQQELNSLFESIHNFSRTGNRSSNKGLVVKNSGNHGDALQQLYHQIKDCQNCPLAKTRRNFVFGAGNPDASLMLVGEAPGEEEDRQGEPFVGRAGKLLNKILQSIGFQREEVYITNILKCRPPDNRDPLPDEIAECEPYLHLQIQIIQPKVILALGRIAGQSLLKSGDSLGNLRGKLHDYQGIPTIITYHPAALLRNPQWKYPTWDDVQYLRKVHDAILAGKDPQQVEFKKIK